VSSTTRTLSERDSKRLLAPYGVVFAREAVARTAEDAAEQATALGFPGVCKLGGDAIAHKTERGLVRLGLGDATAVRAMKPPLKAASKMPATLSSAGRRPLPCTPPGRAGSSLPRTKLRSAAVKSNATTATTVNGRSGSGCKKVR
jgi:hypothetical protein